MNNKQLEKLEKLNRLKEKGVISETEFETEKNNILAGNTKIQPSIFEYIRMIYTEKYCSWNGRATRKEYWSLIIVLFMLLLLYIPVAGVLGPSVLSSKGANVLISIAGLFLFGIPHYCLWIRRFHDLGISTITTVIFMVPSFLFQILGLIDPYIWFRNPRAYLILFAYGIIMLIFEGFLPGQKHKNKYGESVI